jgi:hypothetical protein
MTVGGGAIMLTVAAPLLLSEFNDTAPNPHLVLTVAILWYAGVLFWRLRRGTAGVKPIEEMID